MNECFERMATDFHGRHVQTGTQTKRVAPKDTTDRDVGQTGNFSKGRALQ